MRQTQWMRWTLGFVLLLVLSVIVLAMPARLEGPILVTITQSHGVTLSDAVGFVPLSVALGAVPIVSRRDQPASEEPLGSMACKRSRR